MESSNHIDGIIIQGPTTLVPYIAKFSKKPLKIFFQVGFWSSTYPGQFRNHSLIKELGLQVMLRIAEFHQKMAFKTGIIFSNNPLKLKMYKKYAKGYLVSKGLVRDNENIHKRVV